MRGYPLSMVFAEKIVTAVQRGTVNTRWRDYADIALLSAAHDVDGDELAASIDVVATHRNATLTPLDEVLAGYADRSEQVECLGPQTATHRPARSRLRQRPAGRLHVRRTCRLWRNHRAYVGSPRRALDAPMTTPRQWRPRPRRSMSGQHNQRLLPLSRRSDAVPTREPTRDRGGVGACSERRPSSARARQMVRANTFGDGQSGAVPARRRRAPCAAGAA